LVPPKIETPSHGERIENPSADEWILVQPRKKRGRKESSSAARVNQGRESIANRCRPNPQTQQRIVTREEGFSVMKTPHQTLPSQAEKTQAGTQPTGAPTPQPRPPPQPRPQPPPQPQTPRRRAGRRRNRRGTDQATAPLLLLKIHQVIREGLKRTGPLTGG